MTDSLAALTADRPFLQLSLIPSDPTGVQFGHSGFADPRLAPATLTVTFIPEPSTGLLLALGLMALAAGRRRRGLRTR